MSVVDSVNVDGLVVVENLLTVEDRVTIGDVYRLLVV